MSSIAAALKYCLVDDITPGDGLLIHRAQPLILGHWTSQWTSLHYGLTTPSIERLGTSVANVSTGFVVEVVGRELVVCAFGTAYRTP